MRHSTLFVMLAIFLVIVSFSVWIFAIISTGFLFSLDIPMAILHCVIIILTIKLWRIVRLDEKETEEERKW